MELIGQINFSVTFLNSRSFKSLAGGKNMQKTYIRDAMIKRKEA